MFRFSLVAYLFFPLLFFFSCQVETPPSLGVISTPGQPDNSAVLDTGYYVIWIQYCNGGYLQTELEIVHAQNLEARGMFEKQVKESNCPEGSFYRESRFRNIQAARKYHQSLDSLDSGDVIPVEEDPARQLKQI